MESEKLTSDYSSSGEFLPEKSGIVNLYFKKKSGAKTASLDAVFKKVYSEGLAPFGFIKIKGKYPYIARLINGEILQIITFKKSGTYYHKDGVKWQDFEVLWTLATVYNSYMIHLDKSVSENYCVFENIARIYRKYTNSSDYDESIFNQIYDFDYCDNTLFETVKQSLDVVKQVLIPMFDKAKNIASCIDFLYDADLLSTFHCNFNAVSDPNYCSRNQILYIKTGERNDFKREFERDNAIEARMIKEGRSKISWEEHEKNCEKNEETRKKCVACRNLVLDTPEIYEKYMQKMERRKALNTELLRSYGFEI